MQQHILRKAPELEISQWMNSKQDIKLGDCLGKVVLIEAFQMLCPGCVEHGLPQAQKAYQLFSSDDLVVLGLHSVFEHHAAMGPESLKAFLHEYRITFPVGIDDPATDGPVPKTMARYQLQGTPSLILIDRQGRLRRQRFGMMSDLQLGAEIMALIREQPETVSLETASPEMNSQCNDQPTSREEEQKATCDETGCRV